MHEKWISRAHAGRFGLVACVALGAALRIERLGATPLNFDESFTAMAGRLPVGDLFGFLRAHDSHPPLDYLLQLPLSRLAANSFVFRLPAALCSIGALALFAWWMRSYGRAGLIATAAMSICAFQILHGRDARMYGLMQLIGVGAAFLSDSWLRAPRRRHAWLAGALTFVGLMTHVSMILAAIGLLLLAGRRRDGNAWRWRGAIATGGASWALLWGSSFLVQSRGGHSSWIPHTTPSRFVDTISALVTPRAGIAVFVFAAIVAGVLACLHRDRSLAAVVVCCFVVPTILAGLLGLRAPVLLDRALTVGSWGPLVALGFLIDALTRRARVLGAAAGLVAALAMLVSVPNALNPPGPRVALGMLESIARPGDVVAIQPVPTGVELYWTLGVRSDDGYARSIRLPGLDRAVAIALADRPPSGRIWLMQLGRRKLDLRGYKTCARSWRRGPFRVSCIRQPFTRRFPRGSRLSITAIFGGIAAPRTHRSP